VLEGAEMMHIDVHQLTRVEGHGNIVLNVQGGKIQELRWDVTESPRFFEAMLRGKSFEDAPYIASRICGICSIAHTTASLQATEAALNVIASEQTLLLRKILYNAEILESHILHVLILAAPDYLGADSIFPLMKSNKDVVMIALRLKKLAYNLAETLAGRKTHPLSCVVGGFARLPDPHELEDIRKRFENSLAEIEEVVQLFEKLNIPQFTRETEYIALSDPAEYSFITGNICSSDAGIIPIENYLTVTNEFCIPNSTAKYTKNRRESYMVGAMARFNINHDKLDARAQSAAERLGLRAPCHNPFMITVAQIVECVHVISSSIKLIDDINKKGLKEEQVTVKAKAGRGIGAVEAPRGTLFHDYTYDARGTVIKANCVIPTNQNHNNIQKDMEAMVPGILDRPTDEVKHKLEMLVRAYDPCISCSTH
jgi:sulfhydrogenase subunit alpha